MQSPEAFDVDERRKEAPAWLVDLTLLLGLAVIVLGAWLFKEVRSGPDPQEARQAAPTAPSAIRGQDATEIVDRELGAMKSFLPEVYGPMRTAGSMFIDRTTGVHVTGTEQLEDALLDGDVGFSFDPVRTTEIEVAHGDVAVYGTTWGLGTASKERSAAIVIVTFEDGKIVREVMIPMRGVRATDDLLP